MDAIFNFIENIFAVPFGFILSILYNLTNNYLLAIVVLTILVKLCFVPGELQQQKHTLAVKRTGLKIKRLKELHANDPDRYEQEAKAIKAVNPSKGKNGCLSVIIQMVVLIGLFNVIYTPLTNVLHIDDTAVQEIQTMMAKDNEELQEESNSQIIILKQIEDYKQEIVDRKILTNEQLDKVLLFRKNYTFMGLNLAHSPDFNEFNVMWIIPIMVFGVGFCSALYSFILRKKYNPGTGKFTATDALPFISPMTLFVFAFLFPAGVGLYWSISSLLSFIQKIILNKVYNPYTVQLTEEEEQALLATCYPVEPSDVATAEV